MDISYGAPDAGAPPPQASRRAAFFGLDTLIPGSSLYLLARGLRHRHFYARSDLMTFALRRLSLGGAPGPSRTRASSDSALSFVAGGSALPCGPWRPRSLTSASCPRSTRTWPG
jgi:hypothetical protein